MGKPKKFMFCANNICKRHPLLKTICDTTNMTTAVMLNDFSTSEVMFFEVTKNDICFTLSLQAYNFGK